MDATTTRPGVRLQVFLSYCTAEARIADFLREHLVNDSLAWSASKSAK